MKHFSFVPQTLTKPQQSFIHLSGDCNERWSHITGKRRDSKQTWLVRFMPEVSSWRSHVIQDWVLLGVNVKRRMRLGTHKSASIVEWCVLMLLFIFLAFTLILCRGFVLSFNSKWQQFSGAPLCFITSSIPNVSIFFPVCFHHCTTSSSNARLHSLLSYNNLVLK